MKASSSSTLQFDGIGTQTQNSSFALECIYVYLIGDRGSVHTGIAWPWQTLLSVSPLRAFSDDAIVESRGCHRRGLGWIVCQGANGGDGLLR